ncbi:MAG: hypothetical protein PUC65_12430 [Clostridiales bacterium]|nr:hypothetical protein [Clostridiales bacterium]
MKKYHQLIKKSVGIILSVCMIHSLCPTEAFAATDKSELHIVKIDEKHFPQMYKTLRYNMYDKNQDGWLSENEIASLRNLYIDTKISSVEGLEYLTSLEKIIIQEYTGKTLSISDKNENLADLYVNPSAPSFTVNAKHLKRLFVTSIDGKYYVKGEDCYADPMVGYGISTATKSLSVKGCKTLTDLYVTSKNITGYAFTSSIKRLEIRYNSVKKLSLDSVKNLESLKIEGCDQLTDISCSANGKLKYVFIEACNELKNVNFKGLKALTHLYVGNEVGFRKLDLSKNMKIQMAVIDTWNHGMDVTMPSGKKSKLTKYDPQKRNEYYTIADKLWSTLSENGIDYYGSRLIGTDYGWNRERDDNTGEVDYYQKKIVKWNRTEFPELYDKGFPYNIDLDNDGWLTQSELDGVSWISVEKKISNLKGIEYFRLVSTLELKNYTGKTLKISDKNLRLNTVKVHTNQKEFKVDAPSVENIKVEVDKGTSKVDLSKCANAEGIKVVYNSYNEQALSNLVLPKISKKLRYLGLDQLNVKTPNFKNYPNLEILGVFYCPNIPTLDLSNNKEIRGIWLTKSDKVKRTYDLSKCTKLEEFYVNGYKDSMVIKKPKGNSLPQRETNFWIYEVYDSVRSYRKLI